MVQVSILILHNGEAQGGFSVEMDQVPRTGEYFSIDAQASEPTNDTEELEYRQRNEGRRHLKVDKVTWIVNRSLDKGDDDANFSFALVECSDAE